MSFRALVLSVSLLAPGVSRAESDYQRFVNAAVRMYENLEYERALEQIRNARKDATTPELQASVSLYEGIFLADLNRPDDARAAFREALLLQPAATLPLKVAPHVAAAFETLRGEVKKELAPLIAKQEAERKRKAEAEAKANEEAARKRKAEEAARSAELAKLEAERAKLETERAKLTEEQRKKAEAELVAREAKLKAEAERVRREDEQRKADAARVAATDRPEQRSLVVAPEVKPPLELVAHPLRPAHGPPVLPLVFLCAGVGAASVGAYFGVQAGTLTTAARDEPFQDLAARKLASAGDEATVANVLYGTAGAMALGALISGLVWMTMPGEPPPLPPEAVPSL